ncbi:hypothetical protein GCM10009020_35540 [Natronoarchaeum mannanilyticum]|uniref:Sulfatase N-terminal domain-containing protein n=2 Tax=Natronoarchaeum mannanilyticum TaxID=926360 RepID=A0AAV3TER6_9EURY
MVVDACRPDYLSPYANIVAGTADARTPAIESLADEGTVLRRAISAAPRTLPSVTSMLTGLRPAEHGATSRQFAMRYGETVTRQLSESGYECVHLSPKTWTGDWLPQG